MQQCCKTTYNKKRDITPKCILYVFSDFVNLKMAESQNFQKVVQPYSPKSCRISQEESFVDENVNEIPITECYVNMKGLKEVVSKIHLDDLDLEEQRQKLSCDPV